MRDNMRGRWRTLGIVLGTLPLLALLAAPVQAVDVLTVTTPYPTVEVDPGGTVKLPINVQTPTATKVDLSLNGVPDWLAGDLPRRRIHRHVRVPERQRRQPRADRPRSCR